MESLAAGKTAAFDFQFSIEPNAPEGRYSIPFTVQFTNVYGDTYNDIPYTINVVIKIINTNVPARLVLRDASYSQPVVQVEQPFTVTFDVWNMGTLEAKNVLIDMEDNDSFYVLDSMTKRYIFGIKGLKYEKITYSLKPKKDLATGTYGLTVSMQHDGADEELYPLYVPVEGKAEEEEEEEEKDDINIITENVQAPEGTVLVEQPFTASFSVKNTGTTIAESVKITVDGGDKILPRSLNVLTLTNIKPGESVPSLQLVATKDSESRTSH